MRILVLADTHIPDRGNDLPEIIYKEARNADLILHAGDLTDLSIIKKLSKFAEVKAVYGNMDSNIAREQLPSKEIITIGKFKIALIHGEGPPVSLKKFVMETFGNKVDCIVFGHSHSPVNEKIGKTLLFNPGSSTDKIFAPYNSYGILEINKEIKAQIKRI